MGGKKKKEEEVKKVLIGKDIMVNIEDNEIIYMFQDVMANFMITLSLYIKTMESSTR